MKKISALTAAGVALLFGIASAAAAPCAIGTTTSTKGATTKDTSSNVDGGSTTKVTPGGKAESPGTVGALNDTTSRTQPQGNEKKPAVGKVVQGQGSDDC